MKNKDRIQASNAKLRECIAKAENLPNREDGGGDVTEFEKYFAGEPAFLTLPNATEIGYNAFNDEEKEMCNLIGISIPKVTKIDSQAFMLCCGLETVEMPSVKTIGDDAFYGCESLNVELPESLGIQGLGNGAFGECNKLEHITIPKGTGQILGDPFPYCYGLKTVIFRDHPYFVSMFYGCTNITDIYVPWSEEQNGYYAPPWGAVNATVHYNYKED